MLPVVKEKSTKKVEVSFRDLYPFPYTTESRLYYDKCGAVEHAIKCFICGYMETEGLELTNKGEKLPYLGEVREKRYLLEFTKLKSMEKDWKIFVERFLS